MRDLELRILRWRQSLFHGDPLVLDRWLWVRWHLRHGAVGTFDARKRHELSGFDPVICCETIERLSTYERLVCWLEGAFERRSMGERCMS